MFVCTICRKKGWAPARSISVSAISRMKNFKPVLWEQRFQDIPEDERTKEAFLKCIEVFKVSRGKRGGGHVEFIKAAMKSMKNYNLHKDLEVYKALLDVFPKGDLVPKNAFQRVFWHFPQQQFCAIELLDEMEWQCVQPDKELHDLMVSIFGEWNFATKKAKRQLYWMPKLKHTNKYLDRRKIENLHLSNVELAQLALKTICRDAGTQISSFKALFMDGLEFNNWIVSGQSPLQKRLIADLPDKDTCYVDGPNIVWVKEHMLHYVVLSSAACIREDEKFVDLKSGYSYESDEDLHNRLWSSTRKFAPNIHQQSDQTILALAILGINSHEFATAWINHLQSENARLSNLSVLFRLKDIKRSIHRVSDDSNL